MKIVQKILFFGLLVAMQSFVVEAMSKQNFSNNFDNEETNLDNNDKKRKNYSSASNEGKRIKQESDLEKRARTSVKKGISELTRRATLQESTLGIKQVIIPVPDDHVRLVFENFYVLPQGAVESKEERNDEDKSENYVKVDFYQDIPFEVAALSEYIKNILPIIAKFEDEQDKTVSEYRKNILPKIENFEIDEQEKTGHFLENITRECWNEIYALMNLLLKVKRDSYCSTDLDVTKKMFLCLKKRYRHWSARIITGLFKEIQAFGINLLEDALAFLLLNRFHDEGETPLEIKDVLLLKKILRSSNHANNLAYMSLNNTNANEHTSLNEPLKVNYNLVENKLLPKPYLNLNKNLIRLKNKKHFVANLCKIESVIDKYTNGGINEALQEIINKYYSEDADAVIQFLTCNPIMAPYKLDQLVAHFNHPMMERFDHVRQELLTKYIQRIDNDITNRKETNTLPSLKALIAQYQAQSVDYTYIALFIRYCLAHTKQQLAFQKNDLESLPDGIRLFTIAQRMRMFLKETDNSLDLNGVEYLFDNVRVSANVLEKFLDILPMLTTKPIKCLNLNHNQLIRLPSSIGYLTQLKELNLSRNQLTELPHSIGYLTQLEELYLYCNKLTELPPSIGKLTQLKKLMPGYNNINNLPDSIGYLTELEELMLGYNHLTELPHSIGNLKQLKKLYLSFNKLTKIPDSIGNLIQLRLLVLSHNQLTEIPPSIIKLHQLEYLELDENQLTKIPVGLKRTALGIKRDRNVVFENPLSWWESIRNLE